MIVFIRFRECMKTFNCLSGFTSRTTLCDGLPIRVRDEFCCLMYKTLRVILAKHQTSLEIDPHRI